MKRLINKNMALNVKIPVVEVGSAFNGLLIDIEEKEKMINELKGYRE